MKRVFSVTKRGLGWATGPIVRPLRDKLRQLIYRFAGAAAARRRRGRWLARTMLSEFSRLGFAKKITGPKGKRRWQRVRLKTPLIIAGDELWCVIDQSKLPTGVTTNAIREPDVLQSLEDRLNVKIRCDYTPVGELAFVCRLQGSPFPAVLSINEFQWPDEAPLLAVPLGIDRQGDHRVLDLMRVKHLLVAGATGGGKTTFMHNIINAVASRCSAGEVELWLVDMKGAEFPRYKVLMGTKAQTGIVRYIATDAEAALELLQNAYAEIQRRNRLMATHDASDIGDLARITGVHLPRIVIVIDEFAILTTDSTKVAKETVSKWSTFLMTKIAALGRSSGISIIIATQMVNAKVLSSMITANFENRLAFSVADWRQSQMVIESSEADQLPLGRAIGRIDGELLEVQTPLITPRQTRLEMARIAAYGPSGGLGDDAEKERFVRDAKLLLVVSCEYLDGDFSRAKMMDHPQIRGIISKPRYEEIAKRLEDDGVLLPGRSRSPRRVTRGYFNRPELLDTLYLGAGRTVGHEQAAKGHEVRRPDNSKGVAPHQDAEIIDYDEVVSGFRGQGFEPESDDNESEGGEPPDQIVSITKYRRMG